MTFFNMRNYRDVPLWSGIPQHQWEDWRWQMKNRLRNVTELSQVVELTSAERDAVQSAREFPVGITPYYASLMDPTDPECPIRRQALPLPAEACNGSGDMRDPLHEDASSPVPFITHRYPDRVLFILTEMCAVYCRHCTRRRLVGLNEGGIPKQAIDDGVAYIARTPEVRDVLLSGGDPLTLGEGRLEYVLSQLRQIPHVEVIRIGTRVPVTNPFRVTPELTRMLAKYHPLWINTHFNHPAELTPEATQACARLVDAGIPLGNQTVLLRGINDCPHLQKKLVQLLVKSRVRPYYLYQCDLSQGLEHFRTPIATGIEIIEHLRGHTSGYAVPTYVVDAPGGRGKIPVNPNYVISQSPNRVVLRNYEGQMIAYPEVSNSFRHDPAKCEFCRSGDRPSGIAGLLDPHSPLA